MPRLLYYLAWFAPLTFGDFGRSRRVPYTSMRALRTKLSGSTVADIYLVTRFPQMTLAVRGRPSELDVLHSQMTRQTTA